jgi:hypothetical protein
VNGSTTPTVVVIGGGLGGATCAKYLKIWGGASVNVIMIEPNANANYVAAPGSNLALTPGNTPVTKTYANLKSRLGAANVISGTADHLENYTDAGGTVVLTNGTRVPYDKLVISPGIGWYNTPVFDPILNPNAWNPSKDPHAWRVGDPGDSPNTTQLDLLKSKLLALKTNGNGTGTVVIRIPKTPFRATAAAYSRAASIANYLGSPFKVIVLDHNSGVTLNNNTALVQPAPVQTGIQGEAQAFYDEFQRLHGVGILDYYWGVATENLDFGNSGNNNRLLSWTALGNLNTLATTPAPTITFTLNQMDVLNYIPDQRAGDFLTPLLTTLAAHVPPWSTRWATVDPRTYVMQGLPVSNIHVLGDSGNAADPLQPAAPAPAVATKPIPKGGHMANSQAKVCANAILNTLAGSPVDTNITVVSTGFDPISSTQALYATAVYQYEAPSTAFELGDMAKKQWNATTSAFDTALPTFGLSTTASPQNMSDMNRWVNSLLNDSFA